MVCNGRLGGCVGVVPGLYGRLAGVGHGLGASVGSGGGGGLGAEVDRSGGGCRLGVDTGGGDVVGLGFGLIR